MGNSSSVSQNQNNNKPKERKDLVKDRYLDLSNNAFNAWLRSDQLSHVECLNLQNNEIVTMPPQVLQMIQLKELNLSNNHKFMDLRGIGNLTRLEKLHLSYNSIAQIPPEIGQLSNLVRLSAVSNFIHSIPVEIGYLQHLQILEIWKNRLICLPEGIGQLTDLRILTLSDNSLYQIPSSISRLTNLQILNLHNNRLESLPSSIGNLKNINTLTLSCNLLTTLPAEIGQLTTLTLLDIRSNPFEHLPHQMLSLYNTNATLISFNCKNLKSPLKEFLHGQASDLQDHLEGKRDTENYWRIIRTLWAGNSKNSPEDCPLARLPPEVFEMVLEYVWQLADTRTITQKIFENMTHTTWKKCCKTLCTVYNTDAVSADNLRHLLESNGEVTVSDWKRLHEWFVVSGWSINDLIKVSGYSWFFGFMDALEAKRYLQSLPIGSFLVRFSTTPGWFVLSVHHGRVVHWRIATENEGEEMRFVLEKKKYNTLEELLQRHSQGNEPLFVHMHPQHGHSCFLIHPTDRTQFKATK